LMKFESFVTIRGSSPESSKVASDVGSELFIYRA